MYFLAANKDHSIIEADLGGRVTPGEVRTFGQELMALLEARPISGSLIKLNWSKALPFDTETYYLLDELRDSCMNLGARIVIIVRTQAELFWYHEYRQSLVQQGLESYEVAESLEEFAARAA